MVKCWPLCKLVVYFQQGHCPTSNKSVAGPRQDSMNPCRAHAVRLGHATYICMYMYVCMHVAMQRKQERIRTRAYVLLKKVIYSMHSTVACTKSQLAVYFSFFVVIRLACPGLIKGRQECTWCQPPTEMGTLPLRLWRSSRPKVSLYRPSSSPSSHAFVVSGKGTCMYDLSQSKPIHTIVSYEPREYL